MAKRGRPRKNKEPETDEVKVNSPEETTSEDVPFEGIAPTRWDVEDEVELLEVDPYYEESAQYGRNADDAMGGIGLNYGDW